MDKIINKKELFLHFGINKDNISSTIIGTLNKLGDFFSTKQLCEAIIEDFWIAEKINICNQIHDNFCQISSIFAIACELTDRLKSIKMIDYTKTRGGIFAIIEPINSKNVIIVTFREIVSWMMK
jgi:hypothetical protein